MNEKIKWELEKHPEHFDFQDIPEIARNSKEYTYAMDALRPDWAKKLLATNMKTFAKK